MESCYTVDVVCADCGQVSHAYRFTALFINDRELALDRVVAGIAQSHLLEEAPVDLVDQLEMAGQQAAEQVEIPLLQSFREQGVVGVSHGSGGDVPGPVPLQMPIVDQQAHQLGHGDGRVGVVELNGPVVGEVLNGQSTVVEAPQHVLQRAADEKVLLLQAQTPAFVGPVVGIQHLGERLAAHLFLNSAVVIADVEGIEVEAFGGIGTPQPQPVADVDPIAQHRHVMGDADGVFSRDPARAVVALVIDVALGAATEAHEAGLIGLGQFPGPATLEPLVGDLHLPAIADQLVEDAELITDPVTGGRDLQAGQRLHITSSQTAEPAVAQPRFFLHIKNLLQRLNAEILECVLGLFLNPQVQQVAVKLRTDQEFR